MHELSKQNEIVIKQVCYSRKFLESHDAEVAESARIKAEAKAAEEARAAAIAQGFIIYTISNAQKRLWLPLSPRVLLFLNSLITRSGKSYSSVSI